MTQKNSPKLEKYGVYGNGDKPYEEAIYSLALLYNIINAHVSTYLREYDMTVGKFNILMAIKHQGGKEGISQVDVSKHLIITPSNMSKLIFKLEQENLVTRSGLEGDRRVLLLKVTDQGVRLLDQIWGGYNEILRELYERLAKDKQQKLAELLVEWFGLIHA